MYNSFTSADMTANYSSADGASGTSALSALNAAKKRVTDLQAKVDAATKDFIDKKAAYDFKKAQYDTNYADKRRQNELRPQVEAAGKLMDSALAVLNSMKDALKNATDDYERAIANAEKESVATMTPAQKAEFEKAKAESQAIIESAQKVAGGKKLAWIIGGIALGLAAIGVMIYYIRKSRKG